MARPKKLAPAEAGSPATPPKRVRRPLRKSNRLEIINKDPNRIYRLVNMDPSRLWRFEEAGWRIEDVARHLSGSERASLPTITDNAIMVGGGQKQVLMSIEKEFYDEDQQAKLMRNQEVETALKPKNSDGMYGAELTSVFK